MTNIFPACTHAFSYYMANSCSKICIPPTGTSLFTQNLVKIESSLRAIRQFSP